jgi:hypothetical protein
MQDQWIATFVMRLTAHSLLSLDEAIEVAGRVYGQASRLSPESAADYVLESGLIRRLDRLGRGMSGAMDAEAGADARDPGDRHRRRSDGSGSR